jgi:hypothetical protein
MTATTAHWRSFRAPGISSRAITGERRAFSTPAYVWRRTRDAETGAGVPAVFNGKLDQRGENFEGGIGRSSTFLSRAAPTLPLSSVCARGLP